MCERVGRVLGELRFERPLLEPHAHDLRRRAPRLRSARFQAVGAPSTSPPQTPSSPRYTGWRTRRYGPRVTSPRASGSTPKQRAEGQHGRQQPGAAHAARRPRRPTSIDRRRRRARPAQRDGAEDRHGAGDEGDRLARGSPRRGGARARSTQNAATIAGLEDPERRHEPRPRGGSASGVAGRARRPAPGSRRVNSANSAPTSLRLMTHRRCVDVNVSIAGASRTTKMRREDQPDEREEDLDRRLLRPLLGGRPPALAHLHGEVAHDLADRDAERLALADRAHERAHAVACPTRSSMFASDLVGRQAHGLLLHRQAQLVAERAAEALGRDLHRAGEAEAGLDRDHEQVHELGQLVVDPLQAGARPAPHEGQRAAIQPIAQHQRRQQDDQRAARARPSPRATGTRRAGRSRGEHAVAQRASPASRGTARRHELALAAPPPRGRRMRPPTNEPRPWRLVFRPPVSGARRRGRAVVRREKP